MESDNETLFNEESDLCSSINSFSGCESSYLKASFEIPDNSDTSKISLPLSKNSFEFTPTDDLGFSQSSFTNNSNFSPMVNTFENLSLESSFLPSPLKVRELKKVLSEVNDAYVYWMTSQVLVNICSQFEINIAKSVRDKVKCIIKASSLSQNCYIKDKDESRFTILGLEDQEMNSAIKLTLSALEKQNLNKLVIGELKNTVQQLNDQKKKIKSGVFGTICEKVVQSSSLVTEEREWQSDLHQSLADQLSQACQLLAANNDAVVKMASLVPTSRRQLQIATRAALRDKASLLHTSTSILRFQMDVFTNQGKSLTAAMNELGDKLKASVDSKRESLKSLQKSQLEYEKKEEMSNKFKEIVLEYTKTKRQLHHKHQTLKLLNDPDISFTRQCV